MAAAKTRESKIIGVRMDPEVWRQAKAQADKDGMVLGRWIERAIRHEIARAAKLAAKEQG